MKKDMFKWTCLGVVVLMFAVSLYVYVRLNRYEPTSSVGITFDKWKGKSITPYGNF